MKRILLTIATSMLLIFLATIPSHANPYCTFRGGNCVYFTYECVDAYWGMTPNIPRSWDACRLGRVNRAGERTVLSLSK